MPRANGANGVNGEFVGMNGVSGCWTIGLLNAKAKYLTAETFGFKINANGLSLKKKQMWLLEPAERDLICFKSHLEKYLSVDQYGNVTCEQDERDVSCLFEVSVTDDDLGRWALRNVTRGYYLGAAGDKLVCNAKIPSEAELWTVHLAARPQGLYLSPIGSRAVLKTRSNTVTKDELFALEDSLPQASFIALLNCRYVSVKQGVDVTANQEEVSSHERYQLEYDSGTGRWYIRTMQDKYWTLESGGGIQANTTKPTSNALFDFQWQPNGSVAFRANNGKFISTKKSGHLYANADSFDEDNTRFYFHLINRPVLVLKCDQGFVGYRSSTSYKMECNKASYETIKVERGERGQVYFRNQEGAYWHSSGEGIVTDSDVPEGFYIELREANRMCIKNANGQYLVAEKNGGFKLVGESENSRATLWEY